MEIKLVKNKVILLSILASLSQAVSASDSQEEVDLLRQQIKLLNERLDNLEQQATSKVEVEQKKTKVKKSLADRLSFKADFRDRYEIIDQQGKDSRERNRVRLRAALSMKVNEKTSFTLGIATGGDDPVSTNQTLGDGSSTKDVRLDLAYFDYKFTDSLKLTAGKIKNPFYKPGKNASFWDGDYNPEGVAVKLDNDFLQGSFVGFSLDERKGDAEALMFGGQIRHGFEISDKAELIAGVGYYDYSGLQGYAPLYDGKPRGNTVDANGNFTNDYDIAEVFVEYKSKMMGKPVSFFGNYFQNTTISDRDTSYIVGVKYGKVKGAGTWDIGLTYQDTEADSVVGLFNDSDFAGGNTDSKGMTLKAGYGLQKNMSLGLTYIDSEIGQSLVSQTDYNRLQLDLKLKFK